MKEAGLANEESSAPNEESSAPATQDTTQETGGGLFEAPAAEPEAQTTEKEGKDEQRFADYLARKITEGTLNASEGDIARIKEFYRNFPLNKKITNRWGEQIVFAPEDPAKVDDYIQHFAVKRGGGVETFSQKHQTLFASLEEALANPDERILTETADGYRRICFTKRIEANGNHFVVTAISENGHLLAWTHMNSTDKYVENQRQVEKRCVEKRFFDGL